MCRVTCRSCVFDCGYEILRPFEATNGVSKSGQKGIELLDLVYEAMSGIVNDAMHVNF